MDMKSLPSEMQYAQTINDDIRGMFPSLKLSEKQWRKLERRMRSPFDVSAGAPTERQLIACESGEYYFGFYTTSNDIRDFAKTYNPERTDVDKPSLEDFLFFTHTLSLMMDGNKMVALQRGFISEWHKEHIEGVDEKAGAIGYVLTVLNSDEYKDGYKPTNREIYELQKALGRKPCWFEAYD